MKEYKPFKSGKVRELYDLGDSLVMVCTDRISADPETGNAARRVRGARVHHRQRLGKL